MGDARSGAGPSLALLALVLLAVTPTVASHEAHECAEVGLPDWIARAEDQVWALKNNLECFGPKDDCGLCDGIFNLADLALFQAVIGHPTEPGGEIDHSVTLTCLDRLLMAASADGLGDEVNYNCAEPMETWQDAPPCSLTVQYDVGETVDVATTFDCSDGGPCEVKMRLNRQQVRPGESIGFGIRVTHHRTYTVVVPSRVRFEDVDGNLVLTRTYPPTLFRQGDRLQFHDRIRVPEDLEPGLYRLVFDYSRYRVSFIDAEWG